MVENIVHCKRDESTGMITLKNDNVLMKIYWKFSLPSISIAIFFTGTCIYIILKSSKGRHKYRVSLHALSYIVESFAMGKLHKDIAKHMVQCAEVDEATEEQIIKVNILR